MSRHDRGNSLAFPFTILVLVASALLPTPWLGFATDLAGILNAPVAPLGQVGNAVAGIVRPAADPVEDWPEEVRERARLLLKDRNRWERLFRSSEQEILTLRAQIEQLQRIPIDKIPVQLRLLHAAITLRDPSNAHGLVHLHASERQGILTNTAAVYEGVHLIGRVWEVDRMSVALLPITNEANTGVNARVFPRDRRDLPGDRSPRVRLRAPGDGTLVGDVARDADVGVGDIVFLADASWPESAQFMQIGEIASIEDKEQNPLRRMIVVRPVYQVYDVSAVTLLIEDRSSPGVGE